MITSNVRQVIARVEALKAAIPVAMARALAPAKWEPMARALAEQILRTLAQPQEQTYVAGFVETVTAGTFGQGAGLVLRMRSPLSPQVTIAGAQAAAGAVGPEDLGMNLFQGQLTALEEMVLRWVQTPEEEGGKRRDARDWGKTDEEIAHLITYILVAGDLGPRGLKARTALVPHVEAWLARVYAQQLSAATVRVWLGAVLVGWREMVRLNFRDFMRAELARLLGK